jgi:hypothetical protein
VLQQHDPRQLIFLTEGEEEEEEEEEGEDNHGDDGDNDDELPSCTGHFDQLDVEHNPKPAPQARVYVYHGKSIVASWSGTPLLQQNEDSQIWDSVFASRKRSGQFELDDSSETEGRRTPKRDPRIVLSVPSDEEENEVPEIIPPSRRTLSSEVEHPRRQLRNSRSPTSSPPSPKRLLKKLRASRTAVHLPECEDPFFAGRLAATSVIMVREGLLAEADKLGRWSVNLVGKKQWDKMVECYASAPRLNSDDRNWMACLLDDVHTSLQPVDEEKAAELRGMSSEWQVMGILPRRSMTPEPT